jgi:O-antigen/teichoic acid export membrane protein
MTDAPKPFRRRILFNTAAVGVGNVWAIVISVATVPLTLHGLGTEAFGTWVLLNTFSAMSGWFSLADLGIGAAATREIALRSSTGDHDGARRATASAVVLFLAFGVVFAGVFAVVGPRVLPSVFSTPEDLVGALQFAVVVFAAQVLVDQVTNAVQDALDGLQRTDLGRGIDAVRRTAVAVAVAVVVTAGGGLQGAALASLGASVAGAVLAVVALHRQQSRWWQGPNRHDMRDLLAYGKTLAVLQPLGVITRQMDRLIAGVVIGPGAVTLVELATQVQNGASAVLTAATYAATPASSWVHARQEPELLRELVVRGTRYALLATYPVTVGAAILAPDLIHIWVGPTYAAAAGLVVLALVDIVLTAPVQTGSNVLIGTGRAPDVLRAALGTVAVNLVASVVLAHVIGTAGVFVGTLIALVVLVPALTRATCRQVGLPITTFLRQAVGPAVAACVPMAVLVGAIEALPLRAGPTLALAVPLGAVVYMATVSRLVLSGAERDELRSLLRRERPGSEAPPPGEPSSSPEPEA